MLAALETDEHPGDELVAQPRQRRLGELSRLAGNHDSEEVAGRLPDQFLVLVNLEPQLANLGRIRSRFRASYARILDHAVTRKLPIAICTIYDPRFPDPVRRELASIALCVLNDNITREAMARGLMVYPMGGTIDGARGDHVLLAPPFIIDAPMIDTVVERLGESIDAATAQAA